MSKGLSKSLLENKHPILVDKVLQKKHEGLIAIRKLNLILRSSVYTSESFKVVIWFKFLLKTACKIEEIGHLIDRFFSSI